MISPEQHVTLTLARCSVSISTVHDLLLCYMGHFLLVAVDMCISYIVHLLCVGLRVDHLTSDKRCAFKVKLARRHDDINRNS